MSLAISVPDESEDVVLEEKRTLLRFEDEGLCVGAHRVAVRFDLSDNVDDDAAVEQRLRVDRANRSLDRFQLQLLVLLENLFGAPIALAFERHERVLVVVKRHQREPARGIVEERVVLSNVNPSEFVKVFVDAPQVALAEVNRLGDGGWKIARSCKNRLWKTRFPSHRSIPSRWLPHLLICRLSSRSKFRSTHPRSERRRRG